MKISFTKVKNSQISFHECKTWFLLLREEPRLSLYRRGYYGEYLDLRRMSNKRKEEVYEEVCYV
jgi:hypothetical protein